jgi:hypothetical protein
MVSREIGIPILGPSNGAARAAGSVISNGYAGRDDYTPVALVQHVTFFGNDLSEPPDFVWRLTVRISAGRSGPSPTKSRQHSTATEDTSGVNFAAGESM